MTQDNCEAFEVCAMAAIKHKVSVLNELFFIADVPEKLARVFVSNETV